MLSLLIIHIQGHFNSDVIKVRRYKEHNLKDNILIYNLQRHGRSFSRVTFTWLSVCTDTVNVIFYNTMNKLWLILAQWRKPRLLYLYRRYSNPMHFWFFKCICVFLPCSQWLNKTLWRILHIPHSFWILLTRFSWFDSLVKGCEG